MMIDTTDQPITSFPSSTEVKTSEPESTVPASSEPTSPTPQTIIAPKPAEEPAAKEVDPVTLLTSDSEHLQEEQIGQAMTELQALRSELKTVEEELASTLSELEKELLTLKNTVHVKRIMFEHLKGQLKTTREEWAKAYEGHQVTEKRRKEEFATRNIQIAAIRKKIDEVGARIRTRVGDLDMRKMSE